MWSVELAKDKMNMWGPKGSVTGGPLFGPRLSGQLVGTLPTRQPLPTPTFSRSHRLQGLAFVFGCQRTTFWVNIIKASHL